MDVQFRTVQTVEQVDTSETDPVDVGLQFPIPPGCRVISTGFYSTVPGTALTGSYYDSSNASSPYDQ